MRTYISLAIFILIVLGGGLLLGGLTRPDGWYAALEKPAFNPPNWLFGPVWTVLFVMIAVAGWRTWRRSREGMAMKLWWAQLALNFLWTPVFFRLHLPGAALAIILLLLAAIAGFILRSRNADRVAAWLFAPYAAWVAFASVLNGSIWLLN